MNLSCLHCLFLVTSLVNLAEISVHLLQLLNAA